MNIVCQVVSSLQKEEYGQKEYKRKPGPSGQKRKRFISSRCGSALNVDYNVKLDTSALGGEWNVIKDPYLTMNFWR